MKPAARATQQGFSLVSAIFILVVLAFLAGSMMVLNQAQFSTIDYALQGARAHKAAYSGIQWGAYQALVEDKCSDTTEPFAIDDFTVEVDCSVTKHLEGNVSDNCALIYTIDASASYSTYGEADYVYREINAIIANRGLPNATCN